MTDCYQRVQSGTVPYFDASLKTKYHLSIYANDLQSVQFFL